MICPEQTAKRSQHLPDFQKIVFKIEKWRVDLEQKKEIVYFTSPVVFFTAVYSIHSLIYLLFL